MNHQQQPIIRNPYQPPQARPRYACPEHGPVTAREIDHDYRCTHCGRAVLALRSLHDPRDQCANQERPDRVALPRQEVLRVIDECQCPFTAAAITELLEAYDAHL